MICVIFEDYHWRQFYPACLNRPVFYLKWGALSLNQYIESMVPYASVFRYLLREDLKFLVDDHNRFDFTQIQDEKTYLFISAQLTPCSPIWINQNSMIEIDGQKVIFQVQGRRLKQFKINQSSFFCPEGLSQLFQSLDIIKFDVPHRKWNYLFELMLSNNEGIEQSYRLLYQNNKRSTKKLDGISITGDEQKLWISPQAQLTSVNISTELGPVIIESDVRVEAFSLIEGPCFIGKGCIISSARIHAGTSIFPYCKIGGEVENSIVLARTNKHHDGFLGHAYVGSYVNFGAMSTNSDLKNNYSDVVLKSNGQFIPTRSKKIGCFIGDYNQFGIGSLLNTGTVVGLGCNLYQEGGMYPKNIPSFIWGGKVPFAEHQFEKFIQTSRIIMSRRNQVLNDNLYKLLFKIFQDESDDRKSFLE